MAFFIWNYFYGLSELVDTKVNITVIAQNYVFLFSVYWKSNDESSEQGQSYLWAVFPDPCKVHGPYWLSSHLW